MNFSTLELQSNRLDKTVGDAYLKLQIDRQIPLALPMESAQEVTIVPVSRLTAMPNMPHCVLGLLNQRSRVFWIVDLARLLGIGSLPLDIQQHNIVIVRGNNSSLGLAVESVKGVMRFPLETIQSPIGTVDAGLTPYLRGCVPQEREILLVLDPEAIVNSQVLHRDF